MALPFLLSDQVMLSAGSLSFCASLEAMTTIRSLNSTAISDYIILYVTK